MSDSATFLVVTSIPIPGKTEQMRNYLSQVMPLMVKGGGEPVASYGVIEQLGGDGGPKSIAAIKFPSAQAIKDALSSDEFNALTELRDEAFSRVDQMICTAL